MDEHGWVLIIGAIFFGIQQLFSMWLDYKRGLAAAKGLKVLGAKVEDVHEATNGLTARLVETTRTQAHAAGVLEEKQRNKEPS